MNAIRWTCCGALVCAALPIGLLAIAAAIVFQGLVWVTDRLETAARRVRPISREFLR